MSSDLEIDNLPNRLTLMRVALVPVLVACLWLTKFPYESLIPYEHALNWTAAWIFTVASITDFFDGYIARKRGIVTVFGSFLDPIADKFLVVSSLIMLLSLERVNEIVVITLVLRELYMTSLRLLAMNEGIHVEVNWLGKWKTGFQMVSIPLLMVYDDWWIVPMGLIGTILIYISSFLSLWSAFIYSLGLVNKLKQNRKMKKEQKNGSK
ncbi:MAG: CDP-diacylglycerol--glycerol-3-phosphate 3-phosphatidyltransferase [Bacteriovoracaceae bacterium]